MEIQKGGQICIACSRLHLETESFCQCGHVLKDSVFSENTRKRKAPYRADSVSSEYIGKSEKRFMKVISRQNYTLPDAKRQTRTNKRKEVMLNKRTSQQKHQEKPSVKLSKKQNTNEILELIASSYKNIYFNRCKSYKKVKLSDLDFEFDFSTFDSHNPYYPSALEDINTKITRANAFKRVIEES